MTKAPSPAQAREGGRIGKEADLGDTVEGHASAAIPLT
jgi:hypothetical protein